VPSTSKKQHNFMAAVANNPKFAKKAGVPQSVGEEFMKADKTKKMASGGSCKTVAKKEVKSHEKRMHGMKSGGLAAGHKAADGIAKKGKTRGMEVKMCGGGYMKKGK
jgi:hypothetical protein